MEDPYVRKILSAAFLVILIVLSLLILKPVLISIIVALILVFIFDPVYDWLLKYIKNKSITVLLIIIFILALILLPMWLLTPILIKQSFAIFQATQQIDFVTPLKSFFPDLFASQEFSAEIGSILSSFTSRAANFLVNSLSQIILNFPTLACTLSLCFSHFSLCSKKKKVLSDM